VPCINSDEVDISERIDHDKIDNKMRLNEDKEDNLPKPLMRMFSNLT